MSPQLFDSTSQRRLQRPQLSQKHTVRIKSSARNDHRPPWHKPKDDDATDAQLQQWRRDPAWLTRFWCDVWGRRDQWCVFCTPSFAEYFTRCSPPDLNLVNLEATVAAKWMNSGVSLSWKRHFDDVELTSSLRSVVQVMMALLYFFSYLKCQDEFCQKLWNSVELCQSYA